MRISSKIFEIFDIYREPNCCPKQLVKLENRLDELDTIFSLSSFICHKVTNISKLTISKAFKIDFKKSYTGQLDEKIILF